MGYDRNFIPGHIIPLPTLGARAKAAAFREGEPIEHARFSLVFNRERSFATYTAHNIDGATLEEGLFPRRDDFRPDPEVDEALQVDDRRGYRRNPWDRGHLVRRSSMHWGDRDEAERGDNESFFWTNIAPQHKKLHSGAWGKIERWMVQSADDDDQRVCVFTGPVFGPDDPVHVNEPGEAPIRIPPAFWKVLVITHQEGLKAAGFLVWQRDYDKAKPVAFDPHLEQVRITTLEHLSGLSFGDLRDLDPLRFEQPAARGKLATPRSAPVVRSAADVVL